jgi:uncharacterized protein YndB with AHSA1/START domain
MLTVDRVIAAPPKAVWDVLVDVEEWPQWGPTISRALLDDGGHLITGGSTGQLWTPVGVTFPFVITEFDEGRYWAWTVAGVPATRHRVDPVAEGSRVTFAVPWWSAAYLAVCSLALRRIDDIVAG